MWRAANTLTFATAAVAFTALASPAAAAVTINYAEVFSYSFANVLAPDRENTTTDIQSWGENRDYQPGLNNLTSEAHPMVRNIKKGTLLSSANIDQYVELTPLRSNEWLLHSNINSNMSIISSENLALVSSTFSMRVNYSVDTPSILKIFYENEDSSGQLSRVVLKPTDPNLPGTYLPNDGSGLVTFNIAPGTGHTLSLQGFYQNSIDTVGSASNFQNQKYRFLIVPASVPEPGTWAMMLVGFSALGIGLRRSRTSARRLAH